MTGPGAKAQDTTALSPPKKYKKYVTGRCPPPCKTKRKSYYPPCTAKRKKCRLSKLKFALDSQNIKVGN